MTLFNNNSNELLIYYVNKIFYLLNKNLDSSAKSDYNYKKDE